MYQKAFVDISNGLKLNHVWAYQAYHDITTKYKRTVLGSLWLSGSMITTSISFAVIFGAIFGLSIQQALPYIMAGILAFSLPSYALNDGAEMFMSSGNMIKNHAYPFTYYSLYGTCKAFLLFLHNMVVYFIFMLCIGVVNIPHWSLILGMVVAIIFMLTWGMLMGMMAARFRDMRFLLPYVSQLLSVLTPIFWRPDSITGWRMVLVDFNPAYGLVEIIRAPLLGQMASPAAWTVALVSTALGVLMWVIFFPLNRRRIPFWV